MKMLILCLVSLTYFTLSPSWSLYKIHGTIILPYGNLKIPFTAYYDQVGNSSYISYYSDTSFAISSPKYGSKNIVPASFDGVNQYVCIDGGHLQSVLPNLSEFKRDYSRKLCSSDMLHSESVRYCSVWVRTELHNGKTNTYTLFLDRWLEPVRYEMFGYDTLLMSHYDKYAITYNYWQPVMPGQIEAVIKEMNLTKCKYLDDVEHVDLISQLFFDEEDHSRHFERSRAKHNITLTPESSWRMQKKYRHALRFVMAHNSNNSSYKLRVNHKTFESEMTRCRLETNGNDHILKNPVFLGFVPTVSPQLPRNFDWRYLGAVSPVKDQAICGSCWAFAATGAIESQLFIRLNYSLFLSEQYLMDCSWGEHNHGCFGGLDTNAYKYIVSKGMAFSIYYGEYFGEDKFCRTGRVYRGIRLSGFRAVASDEKSIMSALYHYGPLSIAIDGHQTSFDYYYSGVYTDVNCSSTHLNHAVLLVGYGTTRGGLDYWVIKNSWSSYWGDGGYIRIARKNNLCGVMNSPVIPVLAH